MYLVLAAGIYIRTSSSGAGATKVFPDPVGPMSIF